MGVNTCHFKASLTHDSLCRDLQIKVYDNLTTVDPSSMEVGYFRTYIADRMKLFRETITQDVNEFLEAILEPLGMKYFMEEEYSLNDELVTKLRGCFKDLYWSLRVHLYLHLKELVMPPDTGRLLEMVGRWGDLSDDEMKMYIDSNHIIDPASKLLEMVSRKAVRKMH